MSYYIDCQDKRCKTVKEILEKEGERVFEYSETTIKNICENDCLVFSPAKKLTTEEVGKLPNNVVIYCGAINEETKLLFNEKKIIHCNMMLNEAFAIKNANLTAEGVLAIILEKSDKSMYDNNVLILGGGRIALALSVLFGKIGIKFSIATFNKVKFPSYYLYSEKNYLGYEFLEDIKNFDVVVNTIPSEILNSEQVALVAKNTLFIETASTNCLKNNCELQFNYVLAPGLPGKYSAKTAGRVMREVLKGEIKEDEREI